MKLVILAGGSGKRLWPLSRESFPKQFLKLEGSSSLFQQTVERNLEIVEPSDLYVLASQELYSDISRELAKIDSALKGQIIVEPMSKNTAPALLLALLLFEKQGMAADEVVIFIPSDHLFSPLESYVEAIRSAAAQALKSGGLVVFGIKPTRADTGFGYIESDASGRVIAFHEKPSEERALQFQAGGLLWNAGILATTLGALRKEFAKSELFQSYLTKGYDYLESHFASLEAISIDYAILEKCDCLSSLKLDLHWSDVGSWERVWQSMRGDESGTVSVGEVFAQGCKNSLLLSQKRLLVAIGLEEQIVVETEDAVLVASKSRSEEVKAMVDRLKEAKRQEALEPKTCQRPWGSYSVLEEGPRFKIKKIVVNPLEKLSLQLHYHRSEHWVVVQGTAKVTINGQESIVHEGESLFVPKSSIHRVENPGKVALEIIEVQVGEYLGEDDIVRLEDVYGRLKESEAFKLLGSIPEKGKK